MKLSDAILLGSTMVAAEADGQYFPENQAGCALGMAAIAKGCRFHRVPRGSLPLVDRRTMGVEGVLGNWVLALVARPCQCWRFFTPREMPIKDIIAHLFDRHVMVRKDWTLDQLAEWVKTVEPDRTVRQTAINDLAAESIPEEQEVVDREWRRVRQAFEARHHDRTARPGRGQCIMKERPASEDWSR
jgi:hypothetical protein